MDESERTLEKRISIKELESEELDQDLSKEQKKAAIRAAKATYGKDWKQMLFGAVKSLRVNKETLHTLHGMGVDSSLRDFNDPRTFRGKR